MLSAAESLPSSSQWPPGPPQAAVTQHWGRGAQCDCDCVCVYLCEWLICHVRGECAWYLGLPPAPSLSFGRVTLDSMPSPHPVPALTPSPHPRNHTVGRRLPVFPIAQRPLGGLCQVLCSQCSLFPLLASYQVGRLATWTLWSGTGNTQTPDSETQNDLQIGKRAWPTVRSVGWGQTDTVGINAAMHRWDNGEGVSASRPQGVLRSRVWDGEELPAGQ